MPGLPPSVSEFVGPSKEAVLSSKSSLSNCYIIITTLKRLRQQDCEFKASLSCVARLCLKKIKRVYENINLPF
jgi:hypothetical protein